MQGQYWLGWQNDGKPLCADCEQGGRRQAQPLGSFLGRKNVPPCGVDAKLVWAWNPGCHPTHLQSGNAGCHAPTHPTCAGYRPGCNDCAACDPFVYGPSFCWNNQARNRGGTLRAGPFDVAEFFDVTLLIYVVTMRCAQVQLWRLLFLCPAAVLRPATQRRPALPGRLLLQQWRLRALPRYHSELVGVCAGGWQGGKAHRAQAAAGDTA